MKRKVLALLLASTMVASLAACGGNDEPAVSDSGAQGTTTPAAGTTASQDAPAAEYNLETLNVVVNGTVNATKESGQEEFIAQLQEVTSERIGHDIKIEFQQLDHSGYTDAVGRLFATGDYPDVMIMSAEMFKQYAPTGMLWDMADAYDNADFQSHLTLPGINEGLKDKDGHLYGFAPTYGNGCVTYVKKAWLDAVNIDPTTIKTYDDYYNMLMAFHDGDPDGNGVNGDTYGVIAAGFLGNEAPYINYLPEFWQGAYPAILQGDDGVWYDGFQTQETKDALLRLQKAYNDGAIDPESLTASTKIAREKWASNDQTGAAGAFTYWAGSWYQNLADLLSKNKVDDELVQIAPIAEITGTFGGYLNREAPVWVITDDGDGDDSREQAIFDAFFEVMMDGDKGQTLWTYGAEDVHWSTHAEEFVIYPDDPEKKKEYKYEEGTFHLKTAPTDPNSLWKKNHLDPALVVCTLDNGYMEQSELAAAGNEFFTSNCVDAPASPSSETYTNETGNIYDAKLAVITSVVVENGDVDAAMQTYVDTVGATVEQILSELNAQ